ncbi:MULTISPECIES: hypothetical protein [unclassified Streptomyces]|uniref:hypothetical protein n=1 Tax=unclassified Streptomyces TaxID=2593676 RepID=UPI0019D19209|nr:MULTISPECIES: hypothetical protein [unclassified Streptomyces]
MSLRSPRRPRPLRRASATGTALVVALGPVVVGALLARSVGGDPMVSVNALIAGGGQRARVSRHQLRSCGGRMNARRVQALRDLRGLRARTKPWGEASVASGSRTSRADSTRPAVPRSRTIRSVAQR